jgi:hypothetical protein
LEGKLKVCNFGVPKEWKGKTALSFGGEKIEIRVL